MLYKDTMEGWRMVRQRSSAFFTIDAVVLTLSNRRGAYICASSRLTTLYTELG
jgi:hypothetical protein